MERPQLYRFLDAGRLRTRKVSVLPASKNLYKSGPSRKRPDSHQNAVNVSTVGVARVVSGKENALIGLADRRTAER